jgi:D-alanyl-lipoteichoic acid acyltransferase DltB (MBOAT superfamily)
LRDYLYSPLGGSRGSQVRTYVNLLITMVLGGLWHGANWTFVVWGAYHGALLSVSHYFRDRNGHRAKSATSPWVHAVRVVGTFHLVTVGWILFRAPNLGVAAEYFVGLVGNLLVPVSQNFAFATELVTIVAAGWTIHHFLHHHLVEGIRMLPAFARVACLIAALVALAFAADHGTGKFIYFEF